MLQRLKAFCIRKAMWIFLFVVAAISTWTMLDKMQGEKWRFAVYMDGRGYYAQLPGFFIYDDPSCKFYASQSAVQPDEANFLNTIDGKLVNKYFSGEPFLQLPFFAAGHFIAKNFGYTANGYSEPYFYCIAIAAIFYFLLGLLFLWKLLEKFLFRKRVILFVCICFAFGTNLFHYALYEPSMSHVYSFAAVTGFLYFIRCFFLSPSRRYLLLAAAALGVVALLRPVNLVIVLAFPAMAGEWENVKAGFRWIGKNILTTLIGILIFFAICFVQLYVYHWQTGHFFIWAYRDEGFDFLHPNFFGTLFSYEKGLFVYTPFILLALFGLFSMARKSRYMLFTFLPVIVAIAWIVSSWHEWRYGYSFGLRAYVDYYGLAALPMAFLIDAAFKRKFILIPVAVLSVLLLSLYGIQQYQFNNRIIHAGAMNKEAYWLVFLKTGKKYQDTVTYLYQSMESDGDFNDMEGSAIWPGRETIVEGTAFSGEHSSLINAEQVYSCGFFRNMSDNSLFSHPSRLVISAQILRGDTTDRAELGVAQVKGDTVFFLEYRPLPPIKKAGEWQEVRYEVKIPEAVSERQVLKVYFQQKEGEVYIDDFRIEVKGH